jgi:hypothetical protein
MDASTVPATKEKVRHYLAGSFDGVDFDDEGVASFPYGSAHVFVSVEVFDEDSSVVVIDSPVIQRVKDDPELYRFIATRAESTSFGHLCVTGSGDDLTVHFGHTLLGDYLDDMELRMAAVAVAVTSDQLDDELKERFGGERYHEDG